MPRTKKVGMIGINSSNSPKRKAINSSTKRKERRKSLVKWIWGKDLPRCKGGQMGLGKPRERSEYRESIWRARNFGPCLLFHGVEDCLRGKGWVSVGSLIISYIDDLEEWFLWSESYCVTARSSTKLPILLSKSNDWKNFNLCTFIWSIKKISESSFWFHEIQSFHNYKKRSKVFVHHTSRLRVQRSEIDFNGAFVLMPRELRGKQKESRRQRGLYTPSSTFVYLRHWGYTWPL